MKRELNKKILFLSIAVLFVLISIFIINAAPIDELEKIFSSPLENFTQENILYYSAGIMLLLLVTLIVYAVADSIPFLGTSHPFLKFSVSLIIGILSVVYLTPEEIYTALMSYKALGIVLTTIFPLIILGMVSYKWNTKYPQYSFITPILWIAFVVALFVKYFSSYYAWTYGNPDPNGIGEFGLLFIGLTGILSLFMIFASGIISRFIFMRRLKGMIVKGSLNTEAEITGKINQLRNYATATPEFADQYNIMIKDLERALRKIKTINP